MKGTVEERLLNVQRASSAVETGTQVCEDNEAVNPGSRKVQAGKRRRGQSVVPYPRSDSDKADGGLAQQRWATLQALLGCQGDPSPVADEPLGDTE